MGGFGGLRIGADWLRARGFSLKVTGTAGVKGKILCVKNTEVLFLKLNYLDGGKKKIKRLFRQRSQASDRKLYPLEGMRI